MPYIQNRRYQWAMQWENIGSGAPQWRLWNGSSWQAIGISDNNISAGNWYTLTIDGNIAGGQVHYLDFIIHGTTHSLTQYWFNPTSETGDGLLADPPGPLDVVVLDATLRAEPDPGANVRRLIGAGQRVLVIDASAGLTAEAAARAAGAHGYLTRDHGLAALAAALRGERWPRGKIHDDATAVFWAIHG